jgi:hypothetical protein
MPSVGAHGEGTHAVGGLARGLEQRGGPALDRLELGSVVVRTRGPRAWPTPSCRAPGAGRGNNSN